MNMSYASDVFHKENENTTLRKIKCKNEPVQTLYQVIWWFSTWNFTTYHFASSEECIKMEKKNICS